MDFQSQNQIQLFIELLLVTNEAKLLLAIEVEIALILDSTGLN